MTSSDDAIWPNGFPTYADLMNREDAPKGSAWGYFGEHDEVGSLNFITAERIVAAAGLINRGRVFNLDSPVNAFEPTISKNRKPAKHTIFAPRPDTRDDFLDSFYLQATSQLDGLRHRRHNVHGFYNGIPDANVDVGSPSLGIQLWAERGIVGRGILVDVDRYLRARGQSLDFEAGEPFEVSLLDEAAAAQGVTFDVGDILLIRTGWAHFFFHEASEKFKASLRNELRCPGLAQSRETLAWLWDHRFAVIAADNVGVEAVPVVPSTPFSIETDGGLMHQELIAMLGLALGELWALDELAKDCASTRSYECFVVAKPLNLVGGVGSPPNAVAIL